MDRRSFNLGLIGLGGAAILPAGLAGCAGTKKDEVVITGIDTHAHVFHRQLPFVPERRYTPDYDAHPEEFMAIFRQNGLSHGVIIPISILGTNNDYTLECIRASGGRLRGLAVIDPEKDVGKIDGLATRGIVGIRLNLIGKPVPRVNEGAWRELLPVCRRLRWQVEVYDDAKRLPSLLGGLVDAGVNVVVDHFGKPDARLGVEDPGFKYLLGLGKTRQVWVKLSAPYRSSDAIAAQAAPLLRQAFGADRLLWGSDWPHTGFEGKVKYAALRGQLDAWIPDRAERNIVLIDTPASLFRF